MGSPHKVSILPKLRSYKSSKTDLMGSTTQGAQGEYLASNADILKAILLH